MARINQRQSIVARFIRNYWPLILALCFYSYNANDLNFVQDDANISYRYVANYLNGDGLVYNIGERVEGITNQGWVVFLILLGRLGLDYVLWSQLIGFLLGAGVIVVTFLLAKRIFSGNKWLIAPAVLLVGINPSLAYWSPAGLETAAFAFLSVLSLYFLLTKNWLLIATLTLAVWMRPDGAVLTGVLVLASAIATRRWPKFTLTASAIALALSIPFVLFKLSYYGSIPPNPFYAKTGFNLTQLTNGLEYSWRYLSNYGFYGLAVVVPVLFWRKLTGESKIVWLYMIGFMLYITLIGGDVLKVHRFYLPVFGPAGILIVVSLLLVTERAGLKRRTFVTVALVSTSLIALTYILPRQFVKTYNQIEKNFTAKMKFYADEFKMTDSTNFSVALPTIGILGYELVGHRIIDMLGLTDSTIARHTEKPIPGMKSTWKEARHNSRYLLKSEPDYILFSTGLKPSAPAEKALLLYSQFLESYRAIAFFYPMPTGESKGILTIAFKKVRPVTGEIVPKYPLAYVEDYQQGLYLMSRKRFKEALPYLNKALKESPKPYNLDLLYQKASAHLRLKDQGSFWPLLKMILAQDSMVFEAHKDLYTFAVLSQDSASAELHKRWLNKLVPWFFPRLDSLTQERFQLLKQQQRRQEAMSNPVEK